MTPIEMAEAMEGRARVRRKITNRENLGDRLSDQLEQAAAMLRDQHLRIQQLEQTQEYLFKKHDADKAEIASLKKEAALQRLSDFTQEAECEPVAWAYIKDGEFWDAIHSDEHAQEEGSYTIPLYTHPVKELTIEEIEEVSKEIFKGYKNFYHYQINFARAILRKAQEK